MALVAVPSGAGAAPKTRRKKSAAPPAIAVQSSYRIGKTGWKLSPPEGFKPDDATGLSWTKALPDKTESHGTRVYDDSESIRISPRHVDWRPGHKWPWNQELLCAQRAWSPPENAALSEPVSARRYNKPTFSRWCTLLSANIFHYYIVIDPEGRSNPYYNVIDAAYEHAWAVENGDVPQVAAKHRQPRETDGFRAFNLMTSTILPLDWRASQDESAPPQEFPEPKIKNRKPLEKTVPLLH